MATRRLVLMRHAKSSWDGPISDHDRPLNQRGKRDAPRIAEALKYLSVFPDLVLHSSARRTTETWELMAPVFSQTIPAYSLESLYLAGLNEIDKAVQTVSSHCMCLFVIGHNPGWEMAVSRLSRHSTSLTTANAAILVAPGSWQWSEGLLSHDPWEMERLLRPKELDGTWTS
ncbi:MAG: histidine phosphatase family protein [Pirellulaceae bacterium]